MMPDYVFPKTATHLILFDNVHGCEYFMPL